MRTVDENGEFVAPWVCYFGGSTPSGNTNTVTNNSPWSGEQPYLSDIYNIASYNNANVQPQYFPADTYQGLTGTQNALMSNLINQTDTGGGAGLQAANQNIASTLSPNYTAQTQGTFNQGNDVLSNEMSSSYLDPANSPTYNQAIQNALAVAMPAATSSFIGGGRTDSGLASAAAGTAATNAAAGLAQQQYDVNQGIQNQAANTSSNNFLTQQANQSKDLIAAPMVDQAMTTNMNTALTTAGLSQQDQQNQINAAVQAWNYGQMQPWNQLAMYEGAVTGTGNPGGSSNTTQPYYTNPLANATSAATGIGSLGLMAYLAFAAA